MRDKGEFYFEIEPKTTICLSILLNPCYANSLLLLKSVVWRSICHSRGPSFDPAKHLSLGGFRILVLSDTVYNVFQS